MTTKTEALQLALEVFSQYARSDQTYAAITAIKETLAQQEQDWEGISADQAMTIALMKSEQEPLGYLCDWGNNYFGLTRQVIYYGEPGSAIGNDWYGFPKVYENLPIYTSPPKREWVGLMDMERLACQSFSHAQTAINTEAKLKELNT